MKKIIFKSISILLILIQSGIVNLVYSAELSEESSVKQCMDAAFKSPRDTKTMWSIPNPIIKDRQVYLACQWRSIQAIEYQAILDVLFSQIDIKVEQYLKTLKWAKNPVESVEDLQKKLWVSWESWSFAAQYNNVCTNEILFYAIDFNKKNDYFKINTDDFTRMTLEWESCRNLTYTKLSAYYDAWAVLISKAIANNYDYEKKSFMSQIKEKYRKFLFKVVLYLWQLKVINWKWYTNTKNASNS